MLFKDDTVQKTAKVISTVILFGVAVLLVYKLRTILYWLAIGAFLAIIINPAVDWFTQRMPGKRRGLAAAIVILIMLLILTSLAIVFIPPLIRQITTLIDNFPATVDRVSNQIQYSDNSVFRVLREHGAINYLRSHQGEIGSAVSAFFIKSLQNVGSTLSSIAAFFTIFAMAMYMSVNGPNYVRVLRGLLPHRHQKDVEELNGRMYTAVTGYVNGNLLTSAIAAVTSGSMALIAGLPYPSLLGLAVGLTDLIPMIGATLGAVIVLIVALTVSLKATIIMLIFFIVYQQFENYVLQPKVMSRTIQMSSFAVFVSALCGGVLAGLPGALVAIPAGACIQILLQHYIPIPKQRTFAANDKLKT